jgi:hypothetical protein
VAVVIVDPGPGAVLGAVLRPETVIMVDAGAGLQRCGRW